MQAKIVTMITAALLAGSALATPFAQYKWRCCCSSATGAVDYSTPCVYTMWSGPTCPAGQDECVNRG